MSSADETLRELLPLCRRVADATVRRYGLPANVEKSELVQAGMIGAWEASTRFDGVTGTLHGWASFRVHGSMLDFLRSDHRLGRSEADVEIVSDQDVDITGIADPAPGPAEIVERESTARARLAALPGDLLAIVDAVLCGTRVDRIAQARGVDPTRVSQQIRKAVRIMEAVGA